MSYSMEDFRRALYARPDIKARAEYSRAMYTKRVNTGRCTQCGADLEGRRSIRCRTCADRYNQRRRELRERRKVEGLCVRCAKPLADDWLLLRCPTCRDAQNQETRAAYARRKGGR